MTTPAASACQHTDVKYDISRDEEVCRCGAHRRGGADQTWVAGVSMFRLGHDICPTCHTTGRYDCPTCGVPGPWTQSVEDID